MNDKFLQYLGNDASLYPIRLAEQFPHIFNKLLDLWETDQAGRYLSSIVFDTRSGRQGFPKEVAAELWKLQWFRLRADADKPARKKPDYWDWINQQ